MGQWDELTNEKQEKTMADADEIIDSLFDGCDEWQCKKCGMKCMGSRYHCCTASIVKTVCEYCKNYSQGKCTLKK